MYRHHNSGWFLAQHGRAADRAVRLAEQPGPELLTDRPEAVADCVDAELPEC
jgi:hypothetical protein